MRESQAIQRLRRIATSPAALGLTDDTALLDGLVLTHDSIAEGVHFLPTDPAASVGWKLVTVNLSDLAAKGATPAAALLSFALSGDDIWDMGFLDGVEAACESYGLALVGGDTISLPPGAPRVFGMTAIGRAGERVPLRSGGRDGDVLWVVGTLGDAAAGLALLSGDGARDRAVGRRLPAPGAAARRRAGARAPRPCDDGYFGRPAARRDAHGGGERAERRDRPGRRAVVAGFHRRAERRSRRAPVRIGGRRRLCACSSRWTRKPTR